MASSGTSHPHRLPAGWQYTESAIQADVGDAGPRRRLWTADTKTSPGYGRDCSDPSDPAGDRRRGRPPTTRPRRDRNRPCGERRRRHRRRHAGGLRGWIDDARRLHVRGASAGNLPDGSAEEMQSCTLNDEPVVIKEHHPDDIWISRSLGHANGLRTTGMPTTTVFAEEASLVVTPGTCTPGRRTPQNRSSANAGNDTGIARSPMTRRADTASHGRNGTHAQQSTASNDGAAPPDLRSQRARTST